MDPNILRFADHVQQGFLDDDEYVTQKDHEAQNIKFVQEQYRAIARGDFAAFIATLSEHITYTIVGPKDIPISGSWHGKDNVVPALERNFAYFAQQQSNVQQVVAQGDLVVVIGHETGIYKPTNRPYDLEWVQIFTIKRKKLVKFKQIYDTAAVLSAIKPDEDD